MNLCKGASVERKAMMLFQRSEQALLTSRNISIVIVIMFVTKYTNHVAEDNYFSKSNIASPVWQTGSDPYKALSGKGYLCMGCMKKTGRQRAILWSRSDSIAPADVFSSSTQEMPCLRSTIILFKKDQSMHHPLTFEKG